MKCPNCEGKLISLDMVAREAAAFRWLAERLWLHLEGCDEKGYRIYMGGTYKTVSVGDTPLEAVEDAMRREGGDGQA